MNDATTYDDLPQEAPAADWRAALVCLRSLGLSQERIAARLCVCEKSVSRWLAKMADPAAGTAPMPLYGRALVHLANYELEQTRAERDVACSA